MSEAVNTGDAADRLACVLVSGELMRDHLFRPTEPGRYLRCEAGLPPDAEPVSAWEDYADDRFFFVYRHPSFREVPPGATIPHVNVQYTGHAGVLVAAPVVPGRVYDVKPGPGERDAGRLRPFTRGGKRLDAVSRVAFDADADEGPATVTAFFPAGGQLFTGLDGRPVAVTFRAWVQMVDPAVGPTPGQSEYVFVEHAADTPTITSSGD